MRYPEYIHFKEKIPVVLVNEEVACETKIIERDIRRLIKENSIA